jgi:hypothetical protein
MSEKKRYKHKVTSKIIYATDTAYALLKDSYEPFPEEGAVTTSTTKATAKKNEDAGAVDDELEKVRGIWKALFNQEPNPRKKIETLQKEIDEFNSGEQTEK